MNLYPAIDLKDGKCVRLLKGRMEDATEFNPDPADQARRFAEAGFSRLHLVDLNGAFDGRSTNAAAVSAALAATDAPVQLGGGIRDRAAIDGWLESGVARVILGTMALRNADLVKAACRDHPGRIVVGIDARDGRVAVEGWAEQSDMRAIDLAKAFEDAGVAAIVFTDIDRDGALQGVNASATAALAEAISIPVIASGGVAGIADIQKLKALESTGIEGCIIGRALYDGRIDPAEALKVANGDA
ncbi:1-(5-phosphoribosyl)-5-[(5-phosphoribosylamino)methylideneamino]imidazole-4-carboxamide isomerase [Minwuia sp.]|uniref:1-(5-phosphoribosyl)-5-[(5- phosphoribosylamino)methylideneamino]imidazole-4- carboxamide isomerase n=1 Tax=Minwuia sp. TaxID=2493630 RepID=UPI003A911D7B